MLFVELYVLLLVICLPPSSTLHINQIIVPNFEMVGESASLKCDYDLQNDKLYSVKWYKDNQEFYRYVPKDLPPTQKFLVNGVDVRIEFSDKLWMNRCSRLQDLTGYKNIKQDTQIPSYFSPQDYNRLLQFLLPTESVHLFNISLESAGLYTCEVSTEAPRFRTTAVTKNMRVIHPPESGPYLVGGSDKYRVGEMLDVNCSSPASHPPVLIKFFLNDEPVNEKDVHKHDQSPAKDGLTPAVSTYSLRIKRNHFRHGYLNLKCTADIYRTFYKSVERNILGLDLGGKALGRISAADKLNKSGYMSLILTAVSLIIWRNI